MTSRALSIAAAAVACCVSPVLALPLIDTASLRETTVAELFQALEEPEVNPSKTLAGKVLAAIALERVTGRKPDPMRFSELY